MPKHEKIAPKRPLKSTIGNENGRKRSKVRKGKVKIVSSITQYKPLKTTYSP